MKLKTGILSQKKANSRTKSNKKDRFIRCITYERIHVKRAAGQEDSIRPAGAFSFRQRAGRMRRAPVKGERIPTLSAGSFREE